MTSVWMMQRRLCLDQLFSALEDRKKELPELFQKPERICKLNQNLWKYIPDTDSLKEFPPGDSNIRMELSENHCSGGKVTTATGCFSESGQETRSQALGSIPGTVPNKQNPSSSLSAHTRALTAGIWITCIKVTLGTCCGKILVSSIEVRVDNPSA